MILKQDSIHLVRLERTQLELVRTWRNSPRVSTKMQYRDHISIDSQQQWFDQLKLKNDFFFVIQGGNQEIGLIHLANIDFGQGTAKSGIFIGEEAFLGTPLPFRASICILDFAFLVLGLQHIEAKVSTSNTNAIEYNHWLGFRFFKRQTNGFDLYRNDQETYAAIQKERKVALKISLNPLEVWLSEANKRDMKIKVLLSTIDTKTNYRLVTSK